PQDNSEIQRRYRLEQHQRQLENKVRRAKRFVEGQSDPDNLKKAKKLLRDAQKELREFIVDTNLSEGAKILVRDYGKEKVYTSNPQNGLTSATNSDRIEDIASGISVKTKYFDGELKYYDITDERINRIQPVKIETLSDENNQKLTSACKELLSYMKGEELGKEGLIAFDMNMNEIMRYKAVDKTASVGLPDLSEDCIIIHNHPSGLLFSSKDYEQFSNVDSIRIFGAVGNDGNVYFIEKTENFDNLQYDFDYFQLQHKYGYFDNEDKHHFNSDIEKLLFSEEFIEGGKNSGFKAYISTNK
ncbi:MAG: phage minor capsid protein, partial [Ruminococcus sp.]|nr:phage minor capsid protein [Ruminococcus sp.]